MESVEFVRVEEDKSKHDDWNIQEDKVQFLQPDLVLFTGDFGNEKVELVRSVPELKFPKAVIWGNHDCYTTQ
ncbi:hypothetical protein MKX01_009302 [Papaver californicum]|nr:hypothetical protein MKX01_009302 [Papaver californicum]